MKKKLFIILVLIFAITFSLQVLSAQGNFMESSYINTLINSTKEIQSGVQDVTLEVAEKFQSDTNKTINGRPVAYELYISISSDMEGYFLETGKFMSGLYIDDSGIYDIANGAYFNETFFMQEAPQDRFVIEGTKEGRFALILTMSDQVPYFGDFISPQYEGMNDNVKLGQRYVENVLEEIDDKHADVFVFELDSTTFPPPPEG
jgi:hypothetical protein